ncbi:Hypothetical predicted protein [Paramuricea clavata]|uniref:Uncharacterized protein n=1 Tax=Paramuricea clavata TaxID=317549 RepID=A0A7D9I6Z6_PARCT|nr:Hypothetical predicted protein [Paramuricea clavata]
MYRLLMMFLLSLDIISQALQETFGDDSDVTSALKFLHNAYPNGRWWLKSDDTDIQEGLRESMRNEWSGDVDIGDGITSKTRVTASNILIFLVSDEWRNFKPYAIPVRGLKYSSLTDKNVRDLKEKLKTAM